MILSLVWSLASGQNLKDVKVSLPAKKMTAKETLNFLQRQTGFRFSYITADLNQENKETVVLQGDNLAEILERLFKGTKLYYEQIGKNIVIKKRKDDGATNSVENSRREVVQRSLRGLVRDEKAHPLAGVTVKVKEGSQLVFTDANGRFDIPDVSVLQPTIVLSYLGYQTKEYVFDVENSTDAVTLDLIPDFGNIDAVTVIAYGTTSKRVSTSSTAGIGSDVIARAPVNNPLEALQGRIAGLEVNSSSGLPGSSFTVRLRGLNSSRQEGNAPLYIVDGIPYFSESLNVFSGDNGSQSPLTAINPADIERIDVLKDADATAIYGSRGANGVILITTKKGKAGRTAVNANVYTGAGKVTKQLDMLSTSEYLELRKEAFANSEVTPDPELPDLFQWSSTEDQNWQKRLLGNTAKLTEANFSVSGGSELTNFLLSGTFRTESTVQPGDNGYKKGSGMLNIGHRTASNNFSVSATANFTSDLNDALATDISQYYNLPPNMPIYDASGDYYWYGNIQNPIAFLERSHESRNKALLTSTTLRYSPLKGLNLAANLGYNYTALNQLQMYPLRSFNPATATTNMSYFGNSSVSSYNIEPQATYTIQLGKGTLDALAGATWHQAVRDGESLIAEDFTSDSQLDNISAAVTIRPRTFRYSKYKYQAAFARLTYNWDNRYIVNGTFRRDGSSRFGPERRVGNFGSLGAAWVLSEEDWFSSALPIVSFAKLRGSYGSTGNDQIGDYGFLDTWSYTSYPYDGVAGLYPTRVANPAYSWERNRKLEMGLETGFLQGRLTLNVNHYRNRSDNQLIEQVLSAQTGFSGFTANLPGIVENKGWEFEISSTNIKSEHFEWNTSANLTVSRNKLVAYPGLEGSGLESVYAIGQPLDIVFGYKFTGVDPETGIAQFADLNGDGEVNPELADMQVLGTRLPEFFGGINNTFRYKNFDLSFLLQFVKQKGEGINFGYSAPAAIGIMTNFDRSVLDRWREFGNMTDIPRAAAVSTDEAYTIYNTFYRHSDAQWVDASFLRLKNVMISYDFTSLLPQLKSQRISLYGQGQNLFTVTNYEGFDPETKGRVVPPLKYYTIGIRLTY
ncbi:SusC/RagA family TonB-linked outer membrane protein [Sphingobacterium sp. LRF_L2]|uniref:SusC/RagA family TonB-linked outer membrane protein n=1 Tax=Sphingobacterium sp. LRF_L2 TaxID=3369421 RepID=UPI003F5DC098